MTESNDGASSPESAAAQATGAAAIFFLCFLSVAERVSDPFHPAIGCRASSSSLDECPC